MIGQYLSNTNEFATVSILQKFLDLNKALEKSTNLSDNMFVVYNLFIKNQMVSTKQHFTSFTK